MKKFLAVLLAAVMCVSCFAACGNNSSEDLEAARDFLYETYKDEAVITAGNYERVANTMGNGKRFPVEWSVDTDKVTITSDGTTAKMTVDKKTDVEIEYTLTATIKDGSNELKIEFKHKIPVFVDYGPIVDQLYELEDNQTLGDGADYTLEGTVIAVNTGYTEANGYITVTFVVEGREDKPVQCYKMKAGEVKDVSTVDVGDKITVKGALKNYKGTYEYNGCVLDAREAAPAAKIYDNAAELIAAVEALQVGYGIAGKQSITGVVKSNDYDASYGNAKVILTVGEKEVIAYRLTGEGLDAVKAGDTITVSGNIMRYKENELEFVQGCTLGAVVPGTGSTENPSDKPADDKPADTTPSGDLDTPEKIVNAVYKLGDKEYLGGSKDKKFTLTGVIISAEEYSTQYKNVTIVIQVGDMKDKPITCFRLKGTGADSLKVGDTITVTGSLMNYDGTFEFDSGCTIGDGSADAGNNNGSNAGTGNSGNSEVLAAAPEGTQYIVHASKGTIHKIDCTGTFPALKNCLFFKTLDEAKAKSAELTKGDPKPCTVCTPC